MTRIENNIPLHLDNTQEFLLATVALINIKMVGTRLVIITFDSTFSSDIGLSTEKQIIITCVSAYESDRNRSNSSWPLEIESELS